MQFQRRLQPRVTVDLVPMIDVVFQLVIFFMLSSTLVTRTGLNLDLPEAGGAEEAVTSTIVLSVVGPDEVQIAGERYTLSELDTLLAENGDEYEDRSIAIEADQSLDYGTMVAVLDTLRRNGIRGANLVAREPEPE